MHEKIYNNISEVQLSFKDKAQEKKYNGWSRPLVQNKVFAATLLTGVLYLVLSQLDIIVNKPSVANIYSNIHMLLMAPFLFIISIMTYFKKNYNLMIFLLAISPIVATLINLVFVIVLSVPLFYLTELYLIIFWIFTISGLRLHHATISAIIVYLIVFFVTYSMCPLSTNEFLMHIFWMSCSFAFGFLSATLLEQSNRNIFFNQEKLEKLATTDILTGLYNRSKFELTLENEIERSNRFHNQFGLVMIDIDFFKNINDTYGHYVGDSVLVEIGEIIKQHTRTIDLAVRWGGEEFAIIYLERDEKKLLDLAENLRISVENNIFDSVGKLTVSLGVTIYKNGDNSVSITKRADKALYEAKNSGRNCTKFF